MVVGWLISGISFIVFLFFQTTGIYTGDSGDLVTAAALGGVPHPPGYPLYTLLGWILTKLPLLTISWRIALLSSLPHAITVGLSYAIVTRLTKRTFAGLVSAFLLLGNYLFFLYSVTPEVFAMLDLFVIFLLYLVVELTERFSWRHVYMLAFIAGLSLSHHHVILFLGPAVFYWAITARNQLLRNRWRLGVTTFLFLVGFVPYLYIPVAARSDAIINWDRAVDLDHFVRLITRRDYGTFISGGAFAPELLPRLIAVKAYAQFVLLDFGWASLLLGILGMWFLWVVRRRVAIVWLIALLFLGPGFFFYASFPLSSRFSLGTYERFLLPTYLLIALLAGVGLDKVMKVIRHRGMRGAIIILFLIHIFVSLFQTSWRFWGIRDDKTAEGLGMDIITSVPQNAIVLLVFDTPLFTTQYVRYALDVRPDVRLIHASRLNSPDYQEVLRIRFPELVIPSQTTSGFAGKFVEANSDRVPLFSNVPFPVGESWYWVPYGLLYQVTTKENLPDVDSMYRVNLVLWSSFHDPKSGILSRYPHLMLSDVLDHYAAGRLALGKTLLRAQKFAEAKAEFSEAVRLGADTKQGDALLLLGVSQSYLGDCDEAIGSFREAEKISVTPDDRIPLFESFTVRDCVGDPSVADELFSKYQEARRRSEPPLEGPRRIPQ